MGIVNYSPPASSPGKPLGSRPKRMPADPIAATAPLQLERYAESEMPTAFGALRLVVYHGAPDGKEHLAVVAGEVGGDDVLARVHSECWTGEVLGSLKCDCRAQFDSACE